MPALTVISAILPCLLSLSQSRTTSGAIRRVAVAKHAQQQAEAAGLGAPAAELADGPAADPPPDPAGGAEAFAQPPAPAQEVTHLQLCKLRLFGQWTGGMCAD